MGKENDEEARSSMPGDAIGEDLEDDGRRYPFSNDLVFEFVMRDADIAKDVAETLFGHPVEHVEHHETQAVLSAGVDGRGIRLDVLLDDGVICYNIEMQASKLGKPGLRIRVYLSDFDASTLVRGDDYDKVRKLATAFVCCFDPFDANVPRYTFKLQCQERPEVRLDTRYELALFNATAWRDLPQGRLRSLLEYVDTGNCPDGSPDTLTSRIDKAVTRANEDLTLRRNIMISMEEKRRLEVEYEVEQKDAKIAKQKAELDALRAEVEKLKSRLGERQQR